MNIRSIFCKHSWEEKSEGPRLKLMICQKCGEIREIHIPCEHTWELEEKTDAYSENWGRKSEYPVEIHTRYVCTKCGETREETYRPKEGRW